MINLSHKVKIEVKIFLSNKTKNISTSLEENFSLE